jgi:predicted transposase YbfD/YdcC
MDARATTGLLRFFHSLNDYRADNVSHSLVNIVAVAVMAVTCGAQGWSEVEAWGRMHLDWLGGFLDLPHGIPSHDTFDRVFRHLDPLEFEKCFHAWSKRLVEAGRGMFIAVDGKTLRRSWKRAWSKTPVHLVSAFVARNHLVLGQLATDSKSNEITAIPQLLALLELSGCTVSIDAMGCQRDIAATIVAQGGHYLLAVKDNQPTLHEKVRRLMDEGILDGFKGMEHGHCQQRESGHGRVETRRVWVSTEVHWLGKPLLEAWPGLASMNSGGIGTAGSGGFDGEDQS